MEALFGCHRSFGDSMMIKKHYTGTDSASWAGTGQAPSGTRPASRHRAGTGPAPSGTRPSRHRAGTEPAPSGTGPAPSGTRPSRHRAGTEQAPSGTQPSRTVSREPSRAPPARYEHIVSTRSGPHIVSSLHRSACEEGGGQGWPVGDDGVSQYIRA